MKSILGVASFLLIFAVTIPYVIDILKGRAKPARSTRILFFGLMTATLIVQSRAFTSWTLAFTVAEVVSQAVLLGLGMKYGVGGMQRLDIVCYVLFAISLAGYIVSGDALIGLLLLCVTDLAAFLPTLVKNWRMPESDSPLWFGTGVVASVLSGLAAKHYTATELLVPGYLAFANLLAFLPLVKPLKKQKPTT